MITIPDGCHEIYQPLDAENYCSVSSATLAKWRREGWLVPLAPAGRGYLYTQAGLDSALHLLGYDRQHTEVEVIYHG